MGQDDADVLVSLRADVAGSDEDVMDRVGADGVDIDVNPRLRAVFELSVSISIVIIGFTTSPLGYGVGSAAEKFSMVPSLKSLWKVQKQRSFVNFLLNATVSAKAFS